MTTDAKIELSQDKRIAILEQKGKQLKAEILSPKDTYFSIESASRPKPEKSNKGVSRLIVTTPKIDGKVRMEVRLVPIHQ